LVIVAVGHISSNGLKSTKIAKCKGTEQETDHRR
jgi:hypothetical protein